MNNHDELIEQLHKLADWIEKENNVQCHSVPRKAAYIITALQDDNHRLWLLNNKMLMYPIDYLNVAVGFIRYQWYRLKKKLKRKKDV